MSELKQKTLIAYKGGGYDGCSWEWNYAYVDEHGEYHDIFSSGYRGCPTAAEFLDTDWSKGDVVVTDTTSAEELQEFVDTECVRGVLTCATWFAENEPTVKFNAKCDCCEKRFDASKGIGEGYHGGGGISIVAGDIICEDCQSAYTCSGCNEFMGKDHKFGETDHLSHACEYCVADAARKDQTPA
jgi:hypothetical protein